MSEPSRPKPLRRAAGLVWRAAPGWTVAGAALVLASGVQPIAVLWLTKVIVDAVAAALATPDPLASMSRILGWVALSGVVALAGAAARAAAELVREEQGRRVASLALDLVHEKSMELDVSFHDDARFHDTMHRAQQEAPHRPAALVQAAASIMQGGVTLAGLLGLLVLLHWGVALALVTAVVPILVVKVRHARTRHAWLETRTRTERRQWEYHWMITGTPHAAELRLFGLGELFRQRHRAIRESLQRDRSRLTLGRAALDLLAAAVSVATALGVTAWVAWRTLAGRLSLGGMVMYVQAFQRAQAAMGDVLAGLATLHETSLFLSRFEELLGLESRLVRAERPLPVPRPMRHGIAFEGVGFRYPGTERATLEDVTFAIRPGEVVALVGENGSGKTTLAKLLCRLRDPGAGRICMDGIDLRDLDPEAYRREISAVFQDFVRYPLSVRENVWLGDVRADPMGLRVERAAWRSGAGAAAARLPRGLDTPLGSRLEGGAELSVGEWQALALARALVRDAQLVVLDEPSASLDPEAEARVLDSLRDILGGRAALIVSHRLSTVHLADRICVLDRGRIVEQGTHDELVRRAGVYARMHDVRARSCA